MGGHVQATRESSPGAGTGKFSSVVAAGSPPLRRDLMYWWPSKRYILGQCF